MVAVTGKKLSELMEMITEECGNAYMEERAYTFSDKVKRDLQKRLFTDREVPDMEPYEVDHISYMDGCKVFLKNGGWVIARFSGTEPLLRIFCEMPTQEDTKKICDRFENYFAL